MYAKLLRMRDNFIFAAINAENDFMKKLWINRAKQVSVKFAVMDCKPISEILNE